MHCCSTSLVMVVFSALTSPLVTAISNTLRAALASPLANRAIMSTRSSDMSMFRYPKPRSLFRVRLRSFTRSSTDKACITNTLHLDRRAPLTSKDGFSVVAPMRIMLPLST